MTPRYNLDYNSNFASDYPNLIKEVLQDDIRNKVCLAYESRTILDDFILHPQQVTNKSFEDMDGVAERTLKSLIPSAINRPNLLKFIQKEFTKLQRCKNAGDIIILERKLERVVGK